MLDNTMICKKYSYFQDIDKIKKKSKWIEYERELYIDDPFFII